ncbi:MAG: transcription termination/antitermination protein NusG [bacterium]
MTTTPTQDILAAEDGAVVSEVVKSDPYHVIYDDNATAAEKAKWYVVHTYSGHELKVAEQLKIRIESMGIKGKIFECLIPVQEKIQVKKGQKKTIKEKILPGYIMIKMIVDDQSWLAVRTTQGVTAFIGSIGRRPTPISDKEVQAIMKFMATEQPKYKSSFSLGEAVKITEGPFTEFLGTVDHIDEAKGKVAVLVSIFGRETPVELEFSQVAKI